MIHPHLWPAVLGACVGLPLLAVAWIWLFRRWPQLGARRRNWLAAGLAIFATAYSLNVYAWLIEPNMLVVRRVTIESANWRGPPLSIAVLSDVHVASPHVDSARAARVVARINALQPDLLVLLGDYAGRHEPENALSADVRTEILGGIATFAAANPRLGVVAVIGNHDSWYGRAQITQALEAAGVATLWNRHVVIRRGAQEFVVAGIADADTGVPNFAEALDGAPAGDSVIVLSHSPDPFVDAPRGVALMLAGHTHCGQVTIPVLGRLIVPSRYGQRFACGRADEDGRTLFVSAGLGTSILPVRFLNPPEIALITLRGAP